MKRIDIPRLARVEGQGSLSVAVTADRPPKVELMLVDPPRLFESLLAGRTPREIPDLVARICGICPVSHQTAACRALEAAAGISPSPEEGRLRRLLMCAEWMESHALHVVFLHGPDFLGAADALEMSRRHPGVLERGLQIQYAGNQIKARLGGRAIHPVNLRVGGFHRTAAEEDLLPLKPLLRQARQAAVETLAWAARMPAPDYTGTSVFLSLRNDVQYPMEDGRISLATGEGCPPDAFESFVRQRQAPHSYALQSRLHDGRPFAVGPLARFNLNFDLLPADVRQAAENAGVVPPCQNPFQSLLVRTVEILFACGEALRLIEPSPDRGKPPAAAGGGAPGFGCSCVEAPRGLLYHRYAVDAAGRVGSGRIVTPTAMNQLAVEADVRGLVSAAADTSPEALRRLGERAVRNYDPCISCSVHVVTPQTRKGKSAVRLRKSRVANGLPTDGSRP